nr:MAG TPA: PemK-like protein [Caudoviricetes sp.]
MISKVNRGDVFIYNFGNSYATSVESKERPSLIISNNKGNTYGTTCLIAPITTRPREKTESNPWQVYFRNGDREQAILLEQIRCVSINKLGRYIGHLDDYTMHNVDIALCIELDLPLSNQMIEESKLASNMFNSISANIKSKLLNFDKFIGTLDNKFDKCIKEISSSISNIKVESISNDNFENSTIKNLYDIKNILNNYNQNITILSNILINLYDKLDYNKNNESNTIIDNIENANIENNNEEIVIEPNDKEKVEKQENSNIIKGIKIKSIDDMIEFMDYYMEHTFEEIENKYHFDKKSATNRKSNYIKRLKNANIDVSKYLVRRNRLKKENY